MHSTLSSSDVTPNSLQVPALRRYRVGLFKVIIARERPNTLSHDTVALWALLLMGANLRKCATHGTSRIDVVLARPVEVEDNGRRVVDGIGLGRRRGTHVAAGGGEAHVRYEPGVHGCAAEAAPTG